MTFSQVGFKLRYMEWAKTVMEAQLPGVIDIGSSGIAPIRLRELGIGIKDLELFGPHFYGEPELRRRIARSAGVGEPDVLPTLGASHALFLVCASLIEPGDDVIVESPGYESLSAVPRALGARVAALRRPFANGFQFDPDDLRRLVRRGARLVIVTNPHNPSGTLLSPECLSALAECAGGDPRRVLSPRGRRDAGNEAAASPLGGSPLEARAEERRSAIRRAGGERRSASRILAEDSGAGSPRRRTGDSSRSSMTNDRSSRSAVSLSSRPWVVVNEVYRDFLRKPPAAGHRLGPRAVSLASLTKVYGLGETRVGWAIADPALVHRASRVNDFGPVNGPYIAERIGALALRTRAKLLVRSRAILGRNQRLFSQFLKRVPRLSSVPSVSAIAFPAVGGVTDTHAFAQSALEGRGVCIVPGEFFEAPGHIRIGLGAGDVRRLEEGLRRLERALQDWE